MAPVRIPKPEVLRNPSLAKRTTYCNQPGKLAFHSERAARRAARRFEELYPDTPQEPYRCACGRWHLATVDDDACPDDPDGLHHVGCGCEDIDP